MTLVSSLLQPKVILFGKCKGCEWEYHSFAFRDPGHNRVPRQARNNLRRVIRVHVRTTGHSVTLTQRETYAP